MSRTSAAGQASVLARLYRDAPGNVSLDSQVIPVRLRGLLHRAAVTDDHLVGLGAWAGVGPVLAVVGWGTTGPGAAGLILAFVFALPVAILARWSGRRRRLLIAALPDAVDATSRSLRSGASFAQALTETVGESRSIVSVELGAVLAAIEIGQPSDEALHEWTQRTPCAEVEMVAAAFALAHQFEAGTAQALDGVSQSLRDRAALAEEIRALTAQATASMRALVLLPVGFLLLDAVNGHQTLDFLVTARLGRFCLGAGICLNLLGWLWMKSTVHRRIAR